MLKHGTPIIPILIDGVVKGSNLAAHIQFLRRDTTRFPAVGITVSPANVIDWTGSHLPVALGGPLGSIAEGDILEDSYGRNPIK